MENTLEVRERELDTSTFDNLLKDESLSSDTRALITADKELFISQYEMTEEISSQTSYLFNALFSLSNQLQNTIEQNQIKSLNKLDQLSDSANESLKQLKDSKDLLINLQKDIQDNQVNNAQLLKDQTKEVTIAIAGTKNETSEHLSDMSNAYLIAFITISLTGVAIYFIGKAVWKMLSSII